MSGVLITDGRDTWPLPHGLDPTQVLAGHGLAGEPVRATRDEEGHVVVEYDVHEVPVVPLGEPAAGPGRRLQRVGAYALVVDEGRLLLSRLSERVRTAAGLWTLPGGGVEEGEPPVDAVAREVWEETGQDIEVGDLVQVQTLHWVGTNAAGQDEDFHAVRLVYSARCPHPTQARVMEVDGSTGEAAWVPLGEVPRRAQTGMLAPALRFVT